MDLENAKRVAVSAAYRGGEILHSHLGKITRVGKKGSIDLVTEADLLSEKAIIETIRERFPKHTILAEESGLNKGQDKWQWFIDPLDGTTNFAHQLPFFSVSIGLSISGKMKAAVVLNPADGELFTAVDGQGAELNGKPIRVSDVKTINDSLLVTGFPYNKTEILDVIIPRFTNCLTAAQGVRRLGSAALDLCYVACSRFEGFWEQNLHPWDTAAGMLIAREAGARITDFGGNPFDVDKKDILATNGYIHDNMLKLLSL